MVSELTKDREVVIRKTQSEAKRWSGYVDTLLRAFGRSDETPPSLGYKMEALRNKRDSMVTKAEALKRHRTCGWFQARRELDLARADLRDSWRSVIGSLEKESLFI